jgi:hypothetical protein
MTMLSWTLATLATLAIGAIGAIGAAGAYAEVHRAPDQP